MRNLAWYISLAITFFGFIIIEFYFTQDPTKSDVNGNEAFIPIVILVPFLLLSIFITWSVGRKYFAIKPLKRPWLLLFVIALILLISIPGEYQLVQNSLKALHGNWNDTDSVIYQKGPFNFYTNSWYFNENMFLLIHLFVFICGFFGRKGEWLIENEDEIQD
ncbi:hypothetical protein [Rummeliibacillus pycnus]|uniref:hypothetical protein n=1 Tax=Rummeliibacillus pycnus TaxID=101070 RepID=UPI0037C97489